MRIGILLTCGKHLHDSIILLRGEVWTHKTSLSSPLFIGVPVPRKGSEWSCICVLMVSFASFYVVSIGIWKCSDSVVFFGGNVPTVWYFLGEIFRQCGIFWRKCSDSVLFFWEMFRQRGIFGRKCSDSVVFVGGNVPTLWYFLLFILLFAQNNIRFMVDVFVRSRLIII